MANVKSSLNGDLLKEFYISVDLQALNEDHSSF